MTKPTQDKETLREAVARAMRLSAPELQSGQVWAHITVRQSQVMADAAIATMFERLRTPSEGMCRAGYFADDLYPQHLCDNQRELHRCVSEPRWQAMLDKFQQENSDER